jgi:hypothetical protein
MWDGLLLWTYVQIHMTTHESTTGHAQFRECLFEIIIWTDYIIQQILI